MTHPTRTRTPWLSQLFGRGPRTPIRRARQTRLGIECLEDRITPVQDISVTGGLQFRSPDAFHQMPDGTYVLAGADTVSIGFPAAGDDFKPLLQIHQDGGTFSLDTTSTGSFTVTGDVTMSLVAQGSGPNHDLPIFQQVDPQGDPGGAVQDFDVKTLLGSGVSINSKGAQPVTIPVVDWVTFQTTGLALAPDDTGGKVGMQGTGKISSADGVDLSSIGFIQDLTVQVNGSNYVWANADGITATGFGGEWDFSTSGYQLAGYTVTGKVEVSYSDPQPDDGNGKRITISGGAELTAPAHEAFSLQGLGGTIGVSLGSVNGTPKFYGLTLAVDGTFQTTNGLELKTLTDFGFSYNFNGPKGPQWEVFGGVEFTIKDHATVDILLGTETNPGLVIVDGKVQTFSGWLNADIELGPVVISSSSSGGVTFAYDRDNDQFEMSGGVGIQVGKDDKKFTLAATLGDSADPGIIYIADKGGLQQAEFGITGSLSIGSLGFSARDAGFHWVKADPDTNTAERWEIHGAYQVNFGAFEAGVQLGTDDNPGIVVDENGLQIDGINVSVENVRLGPLDLQDLEVSYKKDDDGSYDVDVAVTVRIGSFSVGGEFVVIEGKLDSIELSLNATDDPIELGTSGVSLVEVDATVKNIENPSQIAVVGKVGVVYGPTISMLGQDVNLFHAEGDLTVDKDEFILDCTAQLGAYSDDGGHTWQGVLGTGEAKLSLNWRTEIYSLHIEADGVLGVFDIEGDIVFAPGRDILLLAEADVVIPSWVPFVGGDKLAGLGFFFEHVFAHDGIPTSTTFAAWLDFDLFTEVTVGFEVVIDANGNSTWQLIGGNEVTGFRNLINNPDGVTYTYTVDLSDGVPEGTTSLMAKVDWSRPYPGINDFSTPTLTVLHTVNGQTTTITEDKFAAYGIQVIDDARVTSGTSKVIQITNTSSDPYAPLVGDYTLQVDIKGDNNPFPSFPKQGLDDLDIRVVAHSTKPAFANVDAQTPYPLQVPSAPTGKFDVTVKGNADEAYLQNGDVSVSLYRIASADPFRRPVFIQKVQATQTGPAKSGFTATFFQVPIDGLDAGAYTLIAVVDDGTNPPVATDPSPEFTPVFAVRGTVTNQNGTPITGLPVFLDYNRNRIQDANEPGTTTSPDGYAFTAQFDSSTNLASVPVGSPFDVVLPSLSNGVPDSGYEFHDVTQEPGSFQYVQGSPTGSPWTFTSTQIPGDGAGLVANNSDFNNANAPEGNQAAFVQRKGTISQTVSLAAGTYSISFMAAQRGSQSQTFQVKVDGIVVDSFQPAGSSYQAYVTGSFTVTEGSYTIEFLGTNSTSSDNSADNTAFIDAVRILTASNSVPDSGYEFQDVTQEPGAFLYSPIGSPWTFTSTQIPGDGAGLVANGSDFNNANAPEGNQAAFVQRHGSISQTVSLVAGTYTLGFMAAQRPGDQQTFQVKVTDSSGSSVLVDSFQPTGTSYQTYTTDSFTVAAGSYTIEFLGTNSNSSDNSTDNTAFIDAVRFDKRDSFDPVAPAPVTFDGTNTVNQPFALKENLAIKGVVYDDTNSNGNAAAGLPVGGALAYLDTNGNSVRDDGEPTAVTDAGGAYGFAGLAAGGTYTVRLDMTTVGHVTPAEAYVVPARTPGTDQGTGASQYTYGMAFTTERPVVLTSLGVFDDNSDGLTTTLTAVLYDDATKVELARVTFTPQIPGTLVGGTRYLDLPRPIILPAGFQGVIAAYGFGATTDRVGRNLDYFDPSSSVWTTDGGSGRLSFTGGYLATTLNTIPTIPDRIELGTLPFRQVFGLPNPYAAGSFLYRDVPWAPSPSSATSYTVTLDASGSELVEGRNFGLLPPTFFFGQVTGSQVVSGQAQTVPQSGVPVALLADRVVLAVDSGGGGPAGSGFTGDQYVTGGTSYTPPTPIPDIDTSGVAGAAPVDIYQTARVGEDDALGDGGFTYTLPGLSPGSIYTVRLHFAEIEKDFEVAGQRKFNVSINDTQVLFDFDIIDATGGPNTAIARDFQATADINGQIVVDFTDGSANTPLVNAVQILAPVRDVQTPALLAIDSGGAATGNFVADQYVTGGSTAAWWGVINMGSVWDGAPEPVYHTLRIGDQFTYTLPGFEPGRAYTVRLHFADFGVVGPGNRKFNVDINNHRVLTDFDVAAAAGQPWEIAYSFAQFFDAVADENGQIVIDFTKGSVGQPIVSGIEVFEPTNAVDTTTTDVQGNYALVAYGAGQYTVVQQPLTGWEQVAPNYGNPVFTPTTPAVTGGSFPVYAENSAVATADFNSDGRMDLAVASVQPGSPWAGSYNTITFSVLYSQPDGSFSAEQLPEGVAYTNSVPLVTVGDFDGDHLPDLAFVHSGVLDGGARSGTYVYVFLNIGGPDPFDFQHPIKLIPTDANGHGLYADGQNNFYSAVASGDIDGDGADDLVLGLSVPTNQMAWWAAVTQVTSPNPTFGWQGTTPGGWPRPTNAINQIAVADVDGNGYQDVLLTPVVNAVSLHALPYSLGGNVVAVVRKYANGAQQYTNYNGGGGPVTGLAVGPVRPGELPNWYTATPRWLFLDGHLDSPPTSYGNIPVYNAASNNGDGTFTAGKPVWNGGESRPKDGSYNFHLVSGLRMQDMNGDTLPDLVYLYAPTPATQSIAIRLNTGNGFDLSAPPSMLVALPSNLTEFVGDFVVADFDGDGLNDVFVTGTDQSAGMLYLNGTPQNKPGNSLFAAAGSSQTGLDFQSVPVPTKSAVRGQVFEDVYGDGTRNTGDKGVAGAVVYADVNRNGRLDAGEPQATTTATGHYTLPALANGTYSVGVVPNADWKPTTAAAPTPADPITALTFTGGHPGLTKTTRGWSFTTDNRITVTALGWWDQDNDGLGASHQVAIWDTSGNLLMSTTVAAGTAEPLDSGFRFDSVLTGATTLAPGTYVIGGKSEYADLARDLIAPEDLTPGMGITFIENRLIGGNPTPEIFGFPDDTEDIVGVGAFGPNFQFQITPGVPTAVPEFIEVNIANGSVEQADFGRTRRLIGDVGPQTVAAGGSLDVTVPLTAAAAGHRLVYSLDGNVPAGMTIDSTTGELMWAPTAAAAGSHTATVRVRDAFDTRVTDTRAVRIDVTARPTSTPVIAVGGATAQDPYPVFVRTLYRNVLRRLPRPAELNRWVRFLRSGGSRVDVAVALVTSPAYRRKHPNAASFVRSLYRNVLGRRPDARGVASVQANGGDWVALAKAILGTPAGRKELRGRFEEAALAGG